MTISAKKTIEIKPLLKLDAARAAEQKPSSLVTLLVLSNAVLAKR